MQWVQQAEAFKPSKYLTPSLVTSQLQCEPSESIPTPRLIIHTANEEFVAPNTNFGKRIKVDLGKEEALFTNKTKLVSHSSI